MLLTLLDPVSVGELCRDFKRRIIYNKRVVYFSTDILNLLSAIPGRGKLIEKQAKKALCMTTLSGQLVWKKISLV